MSFTYQKSREDIRKTQVLGLLHLQSTPRKAEVVTWGYDLTTPSGRRDNCATALLSLLLVITAVTVSVFIGGKQEINVEICTRETGLGFKTKTVVIFSYRYPRICQH